MNSLLTSLPSLLPLAYTYAEKHEALILNRGIPLTAEELADARLAGVSEPEKIRRLCVLSLPEPENDLVLFAAKRSGLFQVGSSGLTVGYGIYLRQDVWNSRGVLVHECVHVGQYERLGIRAFLDKYVRECIDPGYPFGAMEQEAIVRSREICKAPPSAKV
jgi:hypothetical protein